MHKLGIHTGGDLKKRSEIELFQRFGKAGRHYYKIVRGIDDRAVNPNRIRKSMGTERTFRDDLDKWEDLKAKLDPMIDSVFNLMVEKVNYGRTINLKIKNEHFQTFTRSKTFNSEVRDLATFRRTALELLEENYEEAGKIRLLGVAVSNLMRENYGEGGIQLEFDFPLEE